MPQILIVGAGVIGASVAYHLATLGVRDILVVDRGADFGAGSTPRATGGFRCQFNTEPNILLSLLSREKLRRFEQEIGVDSGYQPCGYLFLTRTEEGLRLLRDAQALQHACGLAEARMVTAAEARYINSAIQDDTILGAAHCPTDGFIRATQILRGYADAAKRLGVRFEFGVEVRRLHTDGGTDSQRTNPRRNIRQRRRRVGLHLRNQHSGAAAQATGCGNHRDGPSARDDADDDLDGRRLSRPRPRSTHPSAVARSAAE
jgi:sarcosine oxidase subunit beta